MREWNAVGRHFAGEILPAAFRAAGIIMAMGMIFIVVAGGGVLWAEENFYDFLGAGATKLPEKAKSLPEGARVRHAPPGRAWNPVWLPDGKRIAFLCDDGGEAVWIMDADTGAPARLTKNADSKSSLQCLPDGRIMYVVGKGKDRGIHVLFADGSSDNLIATGWNPSPSPDGKNIVADTDTGPVLVPIGENSATPKKLPFPDVTVKDDACPRFVGSDKVVYAQEGHIYLIHLKDGKSERILEQNMKDLTYYAHAMASLDGLTLAVFSTNASALSKPPSVWLISLPGGRSVFGEVAQGSLLQWIGNDWLLILRSGDLCQVRAVPSGAVEVLAKGALGGAVSPDGKRLVMEFVFKDTNKDGEVNWKDGSALLIKEMRDEK